MAIGVRSTVFIGFGGTGLRSALWFKRLLLERFGEVPPVIKILVFDSADDRPQNRIFLQNGQEVQLLTDREFHRISYDLQDIADRLHNYEQIASWFPESEMRPLARKIKQLVKGIPGRVRKLGRLCAFVGDDLIMQHIRSAQAEVTGRAQLDQIRSSRKYTLPADQNGGIDFAFSASICGGTGCGMFLDAAYLTRLALRDRAEGGEHRFNAYLVLPDAFEPWSTGADLRVMESNAYAAFKELDHFMRDDTEFRCIYRNKQHIATTEPPFNQVYFIDRKNENGNRVRDVMQLARIIAEAAFINACSPTNDQAESAFTGAGDRLDQRIGDKIAAYSSVGIGFLRYPAEELSAYCSQRLGAEILGRLLASTDTSADNPERQARAEEALRAHVGRTVTDFFARFEPPDHWDERLGKDAYGQPLTFSGGVKQLQRAGRNQLVAEMRGYRTASETRLLPERQAQITTNVQVVRGLVEPQITTFLHSIVDDPTRGAPFAIRVVDHMINVLTEREQEIHSQRHELQVSLADQGDRPDAFLRAARPLTENVFQWWFGSSRRTSTINGYTAAVNGLLNQQIEETRLANALRLQALLREFLLTQRRSLSALESRIRRVKDNLQAGAAQKLPSASTVEDVLEEWIYVDHEFEQTYTGMVGELGVRVDEFFEAATTPRQSMWVSAEDAQIEQWLTAFTAPLFASLQRVTLEEAIEETGESLESCAQRLQGKAVPWFKFIRAELSYPGLEFELPYPLSVLGVGDVSTSRLAANTGPGISKASTGEFRTAIVYLTKHGFTISSYEQARKFRHSYQLSLGQGPWGIHRPLHLDPRFAYFKDPLEEMLSIEEFTEAAALNLLTVEDGRFLFSTNGSAANHPLPNLEEVFRFYLEDDERTATLRRAIKAQPRASKEQYESLVKHLETRAVVATPLEQSMGTVLKARLAPYGV